eukprot:1532180-Rhodomonas_salina.4
MARTSGKMAVLTSDTMAGAGLGEVEGQAGKAQVTCPLSSYVRPMRCPVPRYAMLLSGSNATVR